MATVKLTGGKVVLKNGKVSCTCCEAACPDAAIITVVFSGILSCPSTPCLIDNNVYEVPINLDLGYWLYVDGIYSISIVCSEGIFEVSASCDDGEDVWSSFHAIGAGPLLENDLIESCLVPTQGGYGGTATLSW